MSCQCYQVGGPFIAEDPDCPIHGRNGLGEALSDLEDRNAQLEKELAAWQTRFPDLTYDPDLDLILVRR